MKPRLLPAPLTTDDWLIWGQVDMRFGYSIPWRCGVDADRRDADLMLEWRKLRGIVGAAFSAGSVCGPCFGRQL